MGITRIVIAMTLGVALLGTLFGLAVAPFAANLHEALKALALLTALGGGTGFLTVSLLFFRVTEQRSTS